MILNVCNNSGMLGIFYLCKIVIQMICYIVPVVLVLSLMIRLVKALFINEDIGVTFKSIANKIIAAILVFAVPTIINSVLVLIGGSLEYQSCFEMATLENIQMYKKIEEEKRLENINEIEPSNPDNDGSSSSGSGNQTISGLESYNDYYVVSNSMAFKEHIEDVNFSQDSDVDVYGSSCLGFAYVYASAIITGDFTITRNQSGLRNGNSPNRCLRGTTREFSDKQSALDVVFDEIANNKACILKVNGNVEGTSRHFVVVIGIRKNVTKSSLTEGDLLVLDTWDGQVEKLKPEGSRFMISRDNGMFRVSTMH